MVLRQHYGQVRTRIVLKRKKIPMQFEMSLKIHGLGYNSLPLTSLYMSGEGRNLPSNMAPNGPVTPFAAKEKFSPTIYQSETHDMSLAL